MAYNRGMLNSIIRRSRATPLDDRARLISVFAGALAWSLVLLPPLALKGGLDSLALLLYTALSPICHQIPDRSFHWFGNPLGLCARCTGLLAGFSGGAIWELGRIGRGPSRPGNRVWLWGSGMLLLLDVVAPFLGMYENSHLTRAATGAGFGLALAPHVNTGLAELLGILRGQRVSRGFHAVAKKPGLAPGLQEPC